MTDTLLTAEEICKIACPDELKCKQDKKLHRELCIAHKLAEHYESLMAQRIAEAVASAKVECVKEIETMVDNCEIMACNVDCLNHEKCKAWQQFKGKE